MKKMLSLLTAILLVCAVFTVMPVFAQEETDIRVLVDNRLVDFSGDVQPFINEQNRTMVPIRFVSNELGAPVDWDAAAKKVSIYQADGIIEIVIGDSFAHVNGARVEFDTAAEIVEGRTVVPLRFVSETFGANVNWDGNTRTVYIVTEPPPPAEITLYFSDDQAQRLVRETRELTLTGKPLGELIFDELKKGPQRADLRPTIPEGTTLRSLIMHQNTAQLALSTQFRDNHVGGSAGEQMTLYSIVNSLAQLPEVDEVLFLLLDNQGNPIETEAILGHINTEQPLKPRPDLVQE